MKIACLGWGSLVWKPDSLPTNGIWFENGPLLPIEFARQSADGRITLVVVQNANFPLVQSLWTILESRTLDDAIEALRKREGIFRDNVDKHIGRWVDSQNPEFTDEITSTISSWAKQLEINAVVWTNLPPKFANQNYRIPSIDEVITYLSSLKGESLDKARQYVQMTPQQINTNYRQEIEIQLNWKPQK